MTLQSVLFDDGAIFSGDLVLAGDMKKILYARYPEIKPPLNHDIVLKHDRILRRKWITNDYMGAYVVGAAGLNIQAVKIIKRLIVFLRKNDTSIQVELKRESKCTPLSIVRTPKN